MKIMVTIEGGCQFDTKTFQHCNNIKTIYEELNIKATLNCITR